MLNSQILIFQDSLFVNHVMYDDLSVLSKFTYVIEMFLLNDSVLRWKKICIFTSRLHETI